MWFKQLTGFKEENPAQVRANIKLEGDTLISMVNNRRLVHGRLQVSSLAELKDIAPPREIFKGRIKVSEVVADVQQLHTKPENAGAIFQAASQFNLLEMVMPSVTPEQGIDRYERDHTQGPACAIACGAGTIYRNYFAKVGDQIGQTADQQIDCLDLIGEALNNENLQLWSMQNGYALVSQQGLLTINKKIAALSSQEREALKDKLRIGIQWNTEVTIAPDSHLVTQVYCSALPVAYSQVESIYWESFARVILEATYEATFYAAMENMDKNSSNIVYLTLVGGGAFGNEEYWILESLQQAIQQFQNVPLDVRIVSYGASNPRLRALLDTL